VAVTAPPAVPGSARQVLRQRLEHTELRRQQGGVTALNSSACWRCSRQLSMASVKGGRWDVQAPAAVQEGTEKMEWGQLILYEGMLRLPARQTC
jgi:hypothetical protein